MAYNKYFLSEKKPNLRLKDIKSVVKNALAEDVGKGDITSKTVIAANKQIKAVLLAKDNFILCGIDVAEQVFKTVDSKIKFLKKFKDGAKILNGKQIAVIYGSATSILKAERVALNLLSLMSAIATKTGQFVKIIRPYKTKIVDTRKTIPGLRLFLKYAVRVGGGYNHRMRLDEMILIKDNHLKISGGKLSISKFPKGYKVEIEAQNLTQFRQALNLKPDVIMLDNMKLSDIKKAVRIRNNFPVKLEVSGGVNLGSIRKYAATGVDIISVGELTDSFKSVDISLEVI